MARNGSGTYSLPQPPFTPGTTISSSAVNSDLSDIGAALTQSISKDGQTVYTGNQPMGGNKLTGLGAGTSPNDSVRLAQVADGSINYGGVAGGTADKTRPRSMSRSMPTARRRSKARWWKSATPPSTPPAPPASAWTRSRTSR